MSSPVNFCLHPFGEERMRMSTAVGRGNSDSKEDVRLVSSN